eukprot:6021422-Lingulodinium_polyedra.AAC.1
MLLVCCPLNTALMLLECCWNVARMLLARWLTAVLVLLAVGTRLLLEYCRTPRACCVNAV